MTTTAVAKEVRPDYAESSLYGVQAATVGRTRFASLFFVFVFADSVLVALSGLACLSIHLHATPAFALHRRGSEIAPTLLLLFPLLVVLFCHVQRLYSASEIQPILEKTWAILKAIGAAWLMLAAYLHLSGAAETSREELALAALVSTGVLLIWHIYARGYVAGIAGRGARHALIMGDGRSAKNLRDYLSIDKDLGYFVKGFLGSSRPGVPGPIHGDAGQFTPEDVLGSIDELRNIIRTHFIDELLVALPADRDLVEEAVAVAQECDIPARIVADLYGGVAAGVHVDPLGPFPALSVHAKPVPTLGLLTKRCVDVLLSALALVASSPAFLLIAIAIKLDSQGSVLYRSTRVGRKSATFTCLKFRTMVPRAEALQETLRHLNERDGVLFKMENDPRITRVGRLLRKYSLDELPQFWNVVKGDMSLVGPRPSLPSEVVQYELDHLKRLAVLPGITGLWQVEARRDPSFENYIKLDMEYVDRWSFWLDLKIMLKTPQVVLSGTGQ
jgi:exopolysaccharide biosynthesis polyprenyl glycosylphosphotransferase